MGKILFGERRDCQENQGTSQTTYVRSAAKLCSAAGTTHGDDGHRQQCWAWWQ